ncbi:MAG: FHA domain-containing protein [Pseudoramibacter sp.]
MNKLMPTLTLSNGESFVLKREGLKIGSMASICDITLSDPEVSPLHGMVVNTGDGWAVQELQSRIGLKVNGTDVPRGSTTVLTDGDVIEIAGETLTFHSAAAFFTDAELQELNDLAQSLSQGGEISEDAARHSIVLLSDKIEAIASACGLSLEDFEPAPKPDAPDAEPQKRESSEPLELITLDEVKEEAEEMDKTENDEADHASEETVQFNEIHNEWQLPTICFLTPMPRTLRRYKEKAICVKRTPYNIGADPKNDYVMNNPDRISDVHAQIIQNSETGGFAIHNQDERYGTYINNNLVPIEGTRAIKPGDVVRFGKHEYKVEKL